MIETELKTQLTQSQFEQLYHHFNLNQTTPITQHNTYYDTDTQQLKSIHAALRLRTYARYSEWTLKQRIDNYRALELTQKNPTVVSAPNKLTSSCIYEDALLTFLTQAEIDLSTLHLTFKFTTDRWLIATAYGEYALDRTHYGDQVDYEIELETDNLALATREHQLLFEQLNIPMIPAAKKIQRVAQYFQK